MWLALVYWLALMLVLASRLDCSPCPSVCSCSPLKKSSNNDQTLLRPRNFLPESKDPHPPDAESVQETTSMSSITASGEEDPPPSPVPSPGWRVQCFEITSLDQIQMEDMPPDAVHLDFSSGTNKLSVIKRGAFATLTNLEKLELQNSEITELEEGAFHGLDNLLRLNLSSNRLSSVNASTLEGMPKLERLDLSDNELKGIEDGSFAVLPSLSKVDFASPNLVCDCHLVWIVKWQRVIRGRIHEGTICAMPSDLKGQPVKGLKRKDLHCDREIELPVFTLTPSTSQIVFQGDRLPFECRATLLDSSMQMNWVWGDTLIATNQSRGIIVQQKQLPERTMVSNLLLENLEPDQSGVWRCLVQTSRGNRSKSVNIIVLSEDTLYCPTTSKTTNKGIYHWPKTVAGVTQNLPCSAGPALSYKGEAPALAYYKCSSQGVWEELDTGQCQFSSERTRTLEQLSQVTNSGNVSGVLNGAYSLKSFLSGEADITDSTDVIFTSMIVQTFSQQINSYDRLADIILHVVSTMMNVRADVLLEAQQIDRACSRMVSAVETVADQLLMTRKAAHHYAKNIAMEAHVVTRETFSGMTCSAWKDQDGRVYRQNAFECTADLKEGNGTRSKNDQPVEASIHIPSEIFKSVRCLYPNCDQDGSFNVQFIVFKNAKLFPQEDIVFGGPNDPYIASSVISSKIGGVKVENTSHPIEIKFNVPSKGINQRPVYWDTEANGGQGDWSSHGCHLVGNLAEKGDNALGETVKVHCNHLTGFALLQSSLPPPSAFQSWLDECFNMSPAVYAGTIVLVFCTMSVTITYISAHKQLGMPRKAKHCVGNLSMAVLLLCVTYTLGIRTHRPLITCQLIGLTIHYFSLCILFWILILAFVLCKKWSKVVSPPMPPSEPLELGGPAPPRSPVTCYLLGWGIALIICGISGAINWTNYASNNQYCFLSLDAAILTFFLPAGLLVVISLLIFVRMICLIQSSAGRRHLVLEGLDSRPDTEEVNDLDLNSGADYGLISSTGLSQEDDSTVPTSATSTHTPDSSLMDTEYRPVAQLRALFIVLSLYLITWTNAAFAISLPFKDAIPHQEIIFNYLYAFSSAALGIFLLVFYCLGRRDTRMCWRQCFCCEPALDPKGMDSQDIEETDSQWNDMSLRQLQCNGLNPVTATISGNSSVDNSSLNSKSTSFRAAAYDSASSSKKTSNVNLVPSLTTSLTSDLSVFSGGLNLYPNFYNPRQNGIARKYWEKNKQQKLLNQLNKELRRDSEYSSMDEDAKGKRQSYHGNSSEGNNSLNIEIQIQPKKLHTAHSPVGLDHTQNAYNNLHNEPKARCGSDSPLISGIPPHPPLPMIKRNELAPVGGPPSKCNEDISPVVLLATFDAPPSHAPHLYPPLGADPIPGASTCSYDSAGCVLPKSQGPMCNQEYMQRHGSVPRLRDFDGESAASQEQKLYIPDRLLYREARDEGNHLLSESDDFPMAAPLNSTKPFPGGNASAPHPKKAHHRKRRSREVKNGGSRQELTHMLPKVTNDDPASVAPYAHVNHSEKLNGLDRVPKRQSGNENKLRPCSLSAFEKVPQRNSNEVPQGFNSDSQGEGSAAEVWVPQVSAEKQKLKKETSV